MQSRTLDQRFIATSIASSDDAVKDCTYCIFGH